MGLPIGQIVQGDALEVLRTIPTESVHLVVTSPPYADARKAQYGGVAPSRYVEWFLPISTELFRILRRDGTFILNIKEKVTDGERDTYVLQLILALKAQGWLWTEEFVWHKKNCYPGKWPNRFRDAWERCLQFNRSKHFFMDQDAMRVPAGDWQAARANTPSRRQRTESKTGSPFGVHRGRAQTQARARGVYPSNVLHLAAEARNVGHSAAFPLALPDWFIHLFTRPGDTVLDPFVGSGTTLVAASRLGRDGIGIELNLEFAALAERRLQDDAPLLSAAE